MVSVHTKTFLPSRSAEAVLVTAVETAKSKFNPGEDVFDPKQSAEVGKTEENEAFHPWIDKMYADLDTYKVIAGYITGSSPIERQFVTVVIQAFIAKSEING